MKKSIPFTYTLSVGFAIFATFFGAGNLIFPPHLGLSNGGSWIWSFFAYILMDAGLSSVAIIAAARNGGDFRFIVKDLGTLGLVVVFLQALCLGPMAAIPRTAAVTFELAISPHIPSVSSWLITLLYFIIAGALCLKPTKIVSIVGSIMTPLLLIGLLIMIVKGVISPAAPLNPATPVPAAVREGFLSGYQTMDMLGANLFCTVLIANASARNFESSQLPKMFVSASIIASLGLFIVYGGLSYLGAVSGLDPALSNADLLVAIIEKIMGRGGLFLLAVVVTLACLTTGISLISSCSQVFCSFTKGKVSYPAMVVVTCVLSFLVSNLGIDSIIAIASPALEFVYPVAIIVAIASFFPDSPAKIAFSRFAVYCSMIVTLYVQADLFIPADLGSSVLPLWGVDLAWVFPSAVCGLAASLVSKRKALQ